MRTVRIDPDREQIELRVSTRSLVLAAVLVHGPLDVGITATQWLLELGLEGNPLVLELGLAGFVGVKTLVLAGLVVLWSTSRQESRLNERHALILERVSVALLVVVVLLGAAHVLLNGWFLAAHALNGVITP